MDGRIPFGTWVGRWKVIRRASSVELPWWRGMISRSVCCCICGREQIVLNRDLKLRRSTGCRSASCRQAWKFAERFVPAIGTERARDLARALHDRQIPMGKVINALEAQIASSRQPALEVNHAVA
jgi:hypothetical protein